MTDCVGSTDAAGVICQGNKSCTCHASSQNTLARDFGLGHMTGAMSFYNWFIQICYCKSINAHVKSSYVMLVHRCTLPYTTGYLKSLCLNIFYSATTTAAGNCSDGSLRLKSGTSALNGRVELCLNNAWGTICDLGFSTDAATVICRQLGFANTSKQEGVCLCCACVQCVVCVCTVM